MKRLLFSVVRGIAIWVLTSLQQERRYFNNPQLEVNATMASCSKKTQQSVNDEWNAMAGEWDDLAGGYRDSFVKLLWEQTELDGSQERLVVDFGCGTGLLTETLNRLSPKSKFVCIDAAAAMVRVLEDKIKAREWDNVQALCVILANYDSIEDESIKNTIESIKGKVDLIVASSVMSFIPSEDLLPTMKLIGELLKPGGLFCHSDWPQGENHPDGFTVEKAHKMYSMAGFSVKSTIVNTMKMGSMEGQVFVGVAKKD